ncbi:MAG: ABC transporter ATP-binding protein [Thermodesulfovibrionales bacterium]|nr:ABC transporter ATP-binding protein [Thermodesulfovibrionales bacterium]
MDSLKDIVLIKNLYKSYKRDEQIIPVLSNLSLTVKDADFIALMGPSGSGKSTLLNIIAGIDSADSGEVIVNGVNISNLSEEELTKWRLLNVGFIFQFYNLIPVLTAYENVLLPLMLTNLSKTEKKEHTDFALELVGLSDRKDHYPNQLSGGQQQRVAIARAIVTDPAIIVADEPTGDLDKNSALQVLDLINRLNEELKKTIIMVTHDPRAAKCAKNIKYLDKGELIDDISKISF